MIDRSVYILYIAYILMTLSFLTVDTFDILVLDVTKYLKYELESAPDLLTQNVLTAPS